MTNVKIELDAKDLELLKLLEDSFVYIRAIASRDMCMNLSEKEKLKIISDLAEYSHNIPAVLAKGGHKSNLSFLLSSSIELRELIENLK